MLPAEENRISETDVMRQLEMAPEPTDKGRSGYPHEYQNLGDEPLFEKKEGTTLYEYPVMQREGEAYNFDSKPKDDPGPYRAITDQDNEYQGVICHDGDEKSGRANGGNFHRCERR